jgi:hypothetical protein
MIQPKFKLAIVAIALASTAFFSSCNRKDKTNNDNDTEMASDNALSETTFNDVQSIADDASTKKTGEVLDDKIRNVCATLTHDTLSTPKTITIDFGTVNCLCGDGRYRRGKILVSYTGHYKDSGSTHAITFDQYFVNDNHVMGTKSVTNMGHNSSGQSYFSIVANGLIVKTSGDSLTWNSNRTRTWTQGESTNVKIDDVYEITGSASGTKGSNSYTMLITQPLVRSLNCDWISSGKMDVQPSGKPLRSIDFGAGTCDNQATVTIGGVVHNIILH